MRGISAIVAGAGPLITSASPSLFPRPEQLDKDPRRESHPRLYFFSRRPNSQLPMSMMQHASPVGAARLFSTACACSPPYPLAYRALQDRPAEAPARLWITPTTRPERWRSNDGSYEGLAPSKFTGGCGSRMRWSGSLGFPARGLPRGALLAANPVGTRMLRLRLRQLVRFLSGVIAIRIW